MPVFMLISADTQCQKTIQTGCSIYSVLWFLYKTELYCPASNCHPIIYFARRIGMSWLQIPLCPPLLCSTALIRGNT